MFRKVPSPMPFDLEQARLVMTSIPLNSELKTYDGTRKQVKAAAILCGTVVFRVSVTLAVRSRPDPAVPSPSRRDGRRFAMQALVQRQGPRGC